MTKCPQLEQLAPAADQQKVPESPGVALVTGGTSGIGLATVTLLAAQGYRVFLCARNQHKVESTVARIPLGRYSTPDEVAALVGYLVSDSAASITSRALLRVLIAHHWPGNLAELRAEMVAASRTRSVGGVTERDLVRLRDRVAAPPLNAIDTAHRTVIEDKLMEHRGNKLAAAHGLGISRTTLYKRMLQFGIAY